ncbi:MAG: hypothetical protein INR65_05455 [Gluconacetobacter diazotrophicus]|nr:hypothetical protein [Gluconacetobacter diazotrophicus]
MKPLPWRSVFVLAFVLVLGLAARARAELDLDFKLLNATGYDIKEIYISPAGEKEQGPNVLKTVLKDGQTLELTFSPQAKAERWDIKAVYIDDKSAEWSAVKLTAVKELTLHWDKDKGSSATAE